MRRRWTDQELIGYLRQAALELGQPLRYADYRVWSRSASVRPSGDTIVRCLGPWVVVLGSAGLEVDRVPGRYRSAPHALWLKPLT